MNITEGEFTKQEYITWLKVRGFNPDNWFFISDLSDQEYPEEAGELNLAIVNNAYSKENNIDDRCYLDVVKPGWVMLDDIGWVGPVRYVVAFCPINSAC